MKIDLRSKFLILLSDKFLALFDRCTSHLTLSHSAQVFERYIFELSTFVFHLFVITLQIVFLKLLQLAEEVVESLHGDDFFAFSTATTLKIGEAYLSRLLYLGSWGLFLPSLDAR